MFNKIFKWLKENWWFLLMIISITILVIFIAKNGVV